MIGRENIKLNPKQIAEIVEMMSKEESITQKKEKLEKEKEELPKLKNVDSTTAEKEQPVR